jgi:hydrogenase expression/formation protein HypD
MSEAAPREPLSDPVLASRLAAEIGRLAGRAGREVRIMEVCGTHTVAIRRSGVLSLLPRGITLVSGPGCPVCVTPTGYVDNALALVAAGAARIATFGDMLKVPGSEGVSLARYVGSGRVRMVYSPSQLPAIAAEAPLPVVFLGVGFETTTPTVLAAVRAAREAGVENILVYAAFKTVVPALKAVLASPDNRIDAFLLPGHVSSIIGVDAYRFLEEPGGVPGVVTGFEPADILYGILMIMRQLDAGAHRAENAYPRAVRAAGNPVARAIAAEYLEARDDPWRGLGVIPGGGLGFKQEHGGLDARRVFALPPVRDKDPPGCLCGSVIQGKRQPAECAFFGRSCTPDHPVGPCMVSSEGTCAAHLRYGS